MKMIKKIIFTLIICCIFISCGKKGDPIYKDPKEVKKNVVHINKV